MFDFAYYGFLGGVVRGLVGLTKAYGRKEKFDEKYFLFTIIVSGIVGMAAGMLMYPDFRLAILAGYAGTDFLEGMYKIRFRK